MGVIARGCALVAERLAWWDGTAPPIRVGAGMSRITAPARTVSHGSGTAGLRVSGGYRCRLW